MNYTFFIIYIAHFEKNSRATNLVEAAPGNSWRLPGIALWVFFLIQILVYPVLGALVERLLYGTASKYRKTALSTPASQNAIELTNLTKHFESSWFRRVVLSKLGFKPKDTVYAVNGVTWSARRGQMMVLLGANGSGKSTTLDAISGLNSITSGSIELDGTGGLGFCPQKNVLWDELTVFEHVKIFNRLKSMDAADWKFQIEDLVKGCDLGHKLKAKSETLSGGQKRKLQLAMMFTGGSRVCCVDEVSSGLDPLSRRKIWDILLAERGLRTLLLTTHFLDEADVLSDHIIVLSKGHLKAEGSAVELKHHYGGGYRVTLPTGLDYKAPSEFQDISKQTFYDQTSFLPQDSAETSRLINAFEKDGIQGYDISGPTLENVFLRLAEEVNEGETETPFTVPPRKGLDGLPSSDTSQNVKGLQMTTGKGTTLPQQVWILLLKRVSIVRRNYLPYCAAVLLPIITAGFVTLLIKDFDAVGCIPGAQSSTPSVFSLNETNGRAFIPLGPPSLIRLDQLAQRTGQNLSAFHLINTVGEFQGYVASHNHNVTPGGFFLPDTVGGAPLITYVGNGNMISAMITQNVLSNVLTGIPIHTAFQEFAVPFAPGAGKTLQLILYFGLAMAAYPGLFALYPTVERLRKVRALHYSNGIRAAPLWMAYCVFDFVFVLFISAVVTGIFVGVSILTLEDLSCSVLTNIS
jgi:ABC-type multidrug transport system ATPase subunit